MTLIMVFMAGCGGDGAGPAPAESPEACSADAGCGPGFVCVDASCAPEVGGNDATFPDDTSSDDTSSDLDSSPGPEDTATDDGPLTQEVSPPDVAQSQTCTLHGCVSV